MGSSSEAQINSDIDIKGDLNIYIFGDIYSHNYEILQKMFPIEDSDKNGFISLKKEPDYKYSYKFRKLEKIEISEKKKNYNVFSFFNYDHNILSKVLVDHLYELDVHNKNNNVIIFFGEDESIINSIEKLNEYSQETIPFLIMIKNCPIYDEKLHYINYIPNIASIQNNLLNLNELNENDLKELSYKALFNYIIFKLYRIDMFYNELGYDLNKINPFNDINAKIKMHLTIGVMGYSGCGKSTLINIVFDELVSKVKSSSFDVTTKCNEYYLPVRARQFDNIGQIRFLDFPGIQEENRYYNIVEPEVNKKLKDYKENLEQIDVVLFFISNGNNREFTKPGLELIKLLHKNKIKIIFVINGHMNDEVLLQKKNKLKNLLKDNEILFGDFSNLINTDYYQYYNKINRTGISTIFQKIKEYITIGEEIFNVEDITINNYNEKLEELRNLSRIFNIYQNMNIMKEQSKIKANLTVLGYSTLSLGTSALSLFVPLIDAVAAIAYQIAMVYSIFNIYGYNTEDYNIKNIILSGGNTIEEVNSFNEIENNFEEAKEEVINGNIREAIGDITKGAIFAGKLGIEQSAANEAGKFIINKSVETIIKESVEATSLNLGIKSFGIASVNTGKVVMSKTVEQIALKSSKEMIETGTKITIAATSASKGAIIEASTEGFGASLTFGSKQTIKKITETIVVQQGGKAWLINLGKAIPFIGAGINAIMNTFSTAKIGLKLVTYIDKEFENNQLKQVNTLKGKVKALYNILDQLNNIN